MIGNRTRVFALSTAFVILCFTPAAIAAPFDGNWNMVAVTTSGHCGRISIGLEISHGRIYSTGERFAGHGIQLAGRVSASGHAGPCPAALYPIGPSGSTCEARSSHSIHAFGTLSRS